MKNALGTLSTSIENLLGRLGLDMRTKLIVIFLLVKVVPLILVTVIAWQQIVNLGEELQTIAVSDSADALNDSAVENIERLSTDTAKSVARFLYDRDDDLLYLSGIAPTEENYRVFLESKTGDLLCKGEWRLAQDGQAWVTDERAEVREGARGVSTNDENNDMDGFHYRAPDFYEYESVPLYDEITYIDTNGNELVKVVAENSTKKNHPLSPERRNVSFRQNTYVKAETYFDELKNLAPGDIYVSDVIGAYVGTNYIGMYTPDAVSNAAAERGYDIAYAPEDQAYAGKENPGGRRFEGIVRWATPVTDDGGRILGYVTFALNHDHIMEFVDHITPMEERYIELPSAYEGNYAFIWDYQCRNISHPRHHSIVGYDPETGDPQIPWLESSIYDAWMESGTEKWMDFVADIPTFDEQSRQKAPAPALTQAGLVGLDGRYLNNAPQCTGWMDLTRDGGSGSFYILWSGLYKLNTAAAIPYYTGQYAPSAENGYSRRGFGFVAIGAGLEDFTRPARETEETLGAAIDDNLLDTTVKLGISTTVILIFVVIIAIWMASWLTGSITNLIDGISRFRAGERQFRFHAPIRDEFGTLADSFDDMADSIDRSVKNPLSIIDMDRKILFMNEQGLQLIGTTLEEIVGTSYRESSIYPTNSVYDPIDALEEGREAEIYHEEIGDRYIKGIANHFFNKDGEKIGYIIETTDVTDMVLEQIELEAQRTLLDRIFTTSPDLIWYENARGEYVTVNPRFAAIAGRDTDAFTGRTAAEILPPEIAQLLTSHDSEAMASDTPLYSEERITFADGHEEILDAVRAPIRDSGGELTGVLGYARDVTARVTIETELRSTQLELEQAVADANRANEHKGEFLARMSHEIRTPMNAIIGLTNIVLGKLQDVERGACTLSEVTGHVSQIESSSQHLLGLLNDILDISKIEAGKIELSEEVVELPKLLATVDSIIKPRCDEKNIAYITDFDAFDPAAFLCDSLRLRQVLINLLGNAVKFTPECGAVSFSVKRLESRDGKALVHFCVRDTGVGISPEAQEAIFQPFEQASSSVSSKYGGTGLGLAISARIVELFGGEIQLESAVGQGSEFSFQIRLTETESDLPGPQEIADYTDRFAGRRLLLVDDVDINRMIVASMLESTGLVIDEADDGLTAVKAFEQSPENTYDIIFMDVKMPVMDGYEAATAIRAMSRSDAATVPIVALTANAFKEDIDKALHHGMNAHIAKPVEMDRILEVLFRFLPLD